MLQHMLRTSRSETLCRSPARGHWRCHACLGVGNQYTVFTSMLSSHSSEQLMHKQRLHM